MIRGTWERIVAGYLILQAASVLAWWTWLLSNPEPWRHFVGPGMPASVLRCFFAADIALYVLLGGAAIFRLARGKPYVRSLLLLRAGGELYATLAAYGLAFESRGGWLGAVLMTGSTAVSLFLVSRLRP